MPNTFETLVFRTINVINLNSDLCFGQPMWHATYRAHIEMFIRKRHAYKREMTFGICMNRTDGYTSIKIYPSRISIIVDNLPNILFDKKVYFSDPDYFNSIAKMAKDSMKVYHRTQVSIL